MINRLIVPLTLALVRKSCFCTEVVSPDEVAPGRESAVVLRWTPIPGQYGPHAVGKSYVKEHSLRDYAPNLARPQLLGQGAQIMIWLCNGDLPIFALRVEKTNVKRPATPGAFAMPNHRWRQP